jgi:hypothetical protein
MRKMIAVVTTALLLAAPAAAHAVPPTSRGTLATAAGSRDVSMYEARYLTRKVARKLAIRNNVNDWSLRGCSREDRGHVICTIAFYGYNDGRYDCHESLMIYSKGDGYVYSRWHDDNC